jgi:hypothetical protein
MLWIWYPRTHWPGNQVSSFLLLCFGGILYYFLLGTQEVPNTILYVASLCYRCLLLQGQAKMKCTLPSHSFCSFTDSTSLAMTSVSISWLSLPIASANVTEAQDADFGLVYYSKFELTIIYLSTATIGCSWS